SQKEWLFSTGFEIERFGAGTISVSAAPSFFEFSEEALREFILGLSDILAEPSKVPEGKRREILAAMACKKAVKVHDKLGGEEAARLLSDLRECKNGQFCPHGRPTMFYMPRAELLKKFQRTQ
ncbi:MAG: DNA mismatch repair protein MutL, partial [Elusimicrobia bacterium]|nr:DNA mismatch repair protein MutL [Elusimicrobiota bacterium]